MALPVMKFIQAEAYKWFKKTSVKTSQFLPKYLPLPVSLNYPFPINTSVQCQFEIKRGLSL